LAAIPGRLIKGVGSLISGIFGGEKPEEPTTGFTAAYTPTPPPQAPVRKEITLEDLSPSLLRQLKRLLRNTE
jgi:hypothetical protein